MNTFSNYPSSSSDYDDLFPSSHQPQHYGNNTSSSNHIESDSYDSCDLSAISVVTDSSGNGMNHPALIYTYDVRFKTCTEQYLYHEKLSIGEMVTVQCERGYNIGFVDGEALPDPENPPQKRILAKLLDEDNTIKDMLKFKITAEKNALAQCRMHCKGHRLGSFADSIAAEFQFDRKKLTVYLKKFEDVSVCRLVRKLYDTYKMRIKVLEVDDAETMKELTIKYLELSKLDVPLSDAFNFDPATSVINQRNQGKQNKSDKHGPNFSKSHLGQSQHLISSLVQYGPQADKRHKQMSQPTFFPQNTTSNISQPSRSDRNKSHYRHGQMYESKYTHAPNHAVSYSNNPRHQYSAQPHIQWSSSNVNQRSNWYDVDRQYDRYATNGTSHHYLEPFGHEDSSDAVYRSQSEFPYQGNLNEETFFGEQDEYLFPSQLDRYQYPGYGNNNVPNDIEVLSSALLRPTMDKPQSKNSTSSNISLTSTLIAPSLQSQNIQSIFPYPGMSF